MPPWAVWALQQAYLRGWWESLQHGEHRTGMSKLSQKGESCSSCSLLKRWGERAKVVSASGPFLPSTCGQEQVSCEDGWMALSMAGFQPGSTVLHNWFDPSLFLLERVSVGGASQVKSLLQGFLDPNSFLESDRSCLITKSLRSQLSPKAVLKVPQSCGARLLTPPCWLPVP